MKTAISFEIKANEFVLIEWFIIRRKVFPTAILNQEIIVMVVKERSL